MPTAAVAGGFVAPVLALHVLGAAGRATSRTGGRGTVKRKRTKAATKRTKAPKRKVTKMPKNGARKRKATPKKRKRSTTSKSRARKTTTRRKSTAKKGRRVSGIGIGRASDFDRIVGFRLRT